MRAPRFLLFAAISAFTLVEYARRGSVLYRSAYTTTIDDESMGAIFVSYRRADSADVTGRIFEHLTAHFGDRHIFKDVNSIPMGVDFRQTISDAVQQCDVLLAIMGPAWLNARDEAGKRRLDKTHRRI